MIHSPEKITLQPLCSLRYSYGKKNVQEVLLLYYF